MTEASEFRCSAASIDRGEDLGGTASTIRAFLLVENDRSWGVEALRDSRMDAAALAGLRSNASGTGVRVLMARKCGRRPVRSRLRVLAAYAHPERSWAEQVELDDPAALADLDLAALGQGRSLGLAAHPDPIFAVCTHGRHDTCCAEQGRPVAQALTDVRADQTWECSHVGGDRYAANMVVLPYGLYYGRLDPESAVQVGTATDEGRLELAHLRGRSSYATSVQAAEIALRRELGEFGLTSLRLLGRTRSDQLTTTTWSVVGSDQQHQVQVRSTLGDQQLLTCRAVQTNPIPHHEIVEIRRL